MYKFSWNYANTNNHKAMPIGMESNSYLLVPPKFTEKYGEYIAEHYYDGYGHFAGKDIYCLIAEWNRDMIPDIIRKSKLGVWTCVLGDEGRKLMKRYYDYGEFSVTPEGLRRIGYMMGNYNEDNMRLDYPVKITESPMTYTQCCGISENI